MTAVLGLFLLAAGPVKAQKYLTKNGTIRFYSETPVEAIEAHNRQVNSALDLGTGEFVFKVLMKSFEFEKALMQEHFNENYVESDKYPNASFTGKVEGMENLDLTKDGNYDVEVTGDLTIHGVTKPVTAKGTLEVTGGTIRGRSQFPVKPADHDIKIPAAVANNIAETIDVTVEVNLEKFEQ
ncbi:MAG: YceI family protein [Bacteroidales bacterium]|nr:YceI family protein [Bacteroidales bacterium]